MTELVTYRPLFVADCVGCLTNVATVIQDVDDLPVSDLFGADHPVFFVVPKYQREYVWGQTDWEALVDDLVENQSDDGHFLGTFLCVNKERGAHKNPRLEVIDGQQRLTTISLLLAAIFSVLNTEDDRDDDQIAEFVALRKTLVIESEPRVTPQESGGNREDFLAVLSNAGLGINAKSPKWMGNRRIDKAYQFFRKRIAQLSLEGAVSEVEAARDLLTRVRNAVLVKLEVATFSDAFKLFESLNNRGKPLTPIDLIKNSLLAKADKEDDVGLDAAYDRWKEWLEALGDDYVTQERFFRQFYNAMRDSWELAVQGAPIATRSNLIRIYEDRINKDLSSLVERLTAATEQYGRLIEPVDDAWETPRLKKAFADLVRAEGTTAHTLLLYLLLTRDRHGLNDADLDDITQLLVAFSVRRNMTNQPPTYALGPLFMEVISDIEAGVLPVRDAIASKLRARSADDELFRASLTGDLYEDHANVARFVLIQLAKTDMTKESWQDLWARDQNRGGSASYRWTLEHILPQSDSLDKEWVLMLGGEDAANATREAHVHELGNLTITGYNSALGKLSFTKKRDRTDDAGRHIGYKNGFGLNADLAARDDWNEAAIVARTDKLAQAIVKRFPLT